ncbi:isochorismate synthase [Amycolatopsis nigrescens]|uniref:isochorismate synthase n=1 Tax=Amycolatopsis nigrescens TaxID=381445 RepID=UPI0003645755|nr:isochorismate synthase [Amycolatopsis nigrescens]
MREDTTTRSARLVGEYSPGDFLLATGHRTVLGRSVRQAVTDTDPVRLAERVSAALAESATPIAVGVLPFDTGAGSTTPGRVVVPAALRIAGPAHPAFAALSSVEIGTPVSVRPVPEPAGHAAAVSRALAELADGDLRKVVLARALDLRFAEPVPAAAILHNLVRDNPRGYTYAAGLPGGRTLVGASPELLLARQGDRVVSHPHAGSMPRSADPVVDRANGAALLASGKDHVEHKVLTEAVVETLRPFCRRLDVPAEPALVGTPTMWHLGTTITGELVDREVSALRLAAALHPTPAVCGTPTEPARRLVAELEPFDRGYYAGAVGWVDADGDGEWAVAIRCAEVADRSLRLYAGGGIVPASDPLAELDETSAKFQTLLRAMGLSLDL